jgi:hypothetical protein
MIALSLLAFLVLGQPQVAGGDWPAYGRDPGGSRYSPFTQINRSNVQGLKVAWRRIARARTWERASWEARPGSRRRRSWWTAPCT